VTRTEWTCLGALAAAAVATPSAAWLGRRLGVVDRPGSLKPQEKPIPYLGGIGIFAGLLVGVALSRPLYVVPLVMALGLGTADDALELPPGVRMAGQVAIGVVAGIVTETRFATGLSVVLVAAVVVLLMNGVNLIDGLDALAGGVTAVAAGGLAIMLHGDGRVLAAALALSAAGFLLYNRPPASVYMGDGGAYLLGTALALALASGWAKGRTVDTGLACLLVAAVPAAEVVLAIARRLKNRTPLALGDRGHPYDRLVQRGWPGPAAALSYVIIELVLVAIALSLYRAGSDTPAAVAVAVVVLVVIASVLATVVAGPRSPETDGSAA
jgi:UDP-GlcNAc:undecaprenyl-phosphate/decaprenyl-phosphate GlcNAc-1-phosphate transferase